MTATEDFGVKACGRKMVKCGLCSQWRTLPHVIPEQLARTPWKYLTYLRGNSNAGLQLFFKTNEHTYDEAKSNHLSDIDVVLQREGGQQRQEWNQPF